MSPVYLLVGFILAVPAVAGVKGWLEADVPGRWSVILALLAGMAVMAAWPVFVVVGLGAWWVRRGA